MVRDSTLWLYIYGMYISLSLCVNDMYQKTNVYDFSFLFRLPSH
jgi:hypothetical protein